MKLSTAYITIVGSLLLCVTSLADNNTDPHSRLAAHQICQDGVLNPSSPEMWTMFHFGDNFRADPNQGTLGLSIPVYTYSDERFNIPVELCYNTAGGYRPGMQAGPMGLGWTLSCLGAVTREVRGIADEEGFVTTDMYAFKNKFHHYNDENLQSPMVFGWGSVYDSTYVVQASPGNYSHDIRHGYFRDFAFTGKAGAEYMPIWTHVDTYGYTRASFETLPDVFHFSFLGRSGSFILQPGKQVAVYGTADSPRNYIVVANFSNATNGLTSFTITTEDNYVYTFGVVESASSSDGTNSTSDLSLVSTWRLSSIEAPDGRSVSFTYGSTMTTRTLTPTYSYDLADYYSTYHDLHEHEPDDDIFRNVLQIQDTPTTSEVVAKLLTKITIEGRAEIEFSYGPARCEQEADWTTAKKLEGIVVRSLQSNATIRSATLDYHLSGTAANASYPSSGNGITFLSSVYIPCQGRWSMHYDSETSSSFPSMSTRAVDWMGFYNGYSQQDIYGYAFCPTLETVCNTQDRSWMLTMRQGSLSAARSGMLTSIRYPTGGRSDFEYELNDYSLDFATYERHIPSGSAPGYGIRIARILNRDADGILLSSRSFTYVNSDGSSSGALLWRPALYSHYEMATMHFNKITRTTLSTADAFPYSRGVFTEYTRVLETVESGRGNVGASITERIYDSFNAGSCRDTTSNWTNGFSFSGYIGPYPAPNDPIKFIPGWYFHLSVEDPATYFVRTAINDWLQSRRGGRILMEKEYSDDLYHPVRSTEYSYDTYSQIAAPLNYADIQYGFLVDYCYTLQDPWLCQTTVTDYSPSGSVILTTTTVNTIDSNYRPATEQLTDSAGGSVVTAYEWLSACPSLLSKLTVSRNGVLAEGVRRQYSTVSGHPQLYVPTTIQSADPGGSPSSPTWRTEQTCSLWSSQGLPLEICDKAGIPTSIVWAWNGMYPAAKVVGKTFSALTTADSSLQGGVLQGNLSSSSESALRALSGAVVTSFLWDPMVGLTHSKGVSGKDSGFTYDSAGRLSSTQNDGGDTLVSYEYNIYTDNSNQ